jgi:hypothetical protein
LKSSNAHALSDTVEGDGVRLRVDELDEAHRRISLTRLPTTCPANGKDAKRQRKANRS